MENYLFLKSMSTDVQITDFNRKYLLDLSDFNVPVISTDATERGKFEDALIKKIFETKSGESGSSLNTIIKSVNMSYGVGSRESTDTTSEINKCIFGVISNVKLTKSDFCWEIASHNVSLYSGHLGLSRTHYSSCSSK